MELQPVAGIALHAALARVAAEVLDGDGVELAHQLLAQAVPGRPHHLVREELMSKLDAITIEDLCRDARERGVQSEPGERLEFHI